MGLLGSLFGQGIDAHMETARATEGAVVLDVRTPDEFYEGHIEGARSFPLAGIQSILTRIPQRETPLFVYCLSGARSAQACRVLDQLGYADVTDMGGITRWSGKLVAGRE